MSRTAVVGAGIVGLLTAWQLRQNGRSVTVIAPEIGRDATYAAAGMLAPISEVQYGQEKLWPLMTASRAEYPEFLRTLERAAGIPAGYRENGTLLLAADRSDRDAVADLVSVQQSYGMDVEPLSTTALRRREPALAPGLAKGWDVPDDHQVDPRQLMRCATAALDAELDPQEFPQAGPPAGWITGGVTRVDRTVSGRLAVEWAIPASQLRRGDRATEHPPGRGRDGDADQAGAAPDARQRAEFDHAVLAPGLGYDGIAGVPEQLPLQLREVHGDVLRLRLGPDQLLPDEDHLLRTTLRATVRGRSVYLVPRDARSTDGEGGLVVGASSREDGLPGTRAGSVQELLDDAVAVLPAVKDMELMEVTTRARPGTPDERPYLGLVEADDGGLPSASAPSRLLISTGYSRHGILLAPLAARLGAALLDGEALGAEDRQMLEHMDLSR